VTALEKARKRYAKSKYRMVEPGTRLSENAEIWENRLEGWRLTVFDGMPAPRENLYRVPCSGWEN
jgi:hypothetical protein